MSNLVKLHNAVRADEVKNVKALVQHGIDVNTIYQQETAFTRAAECKHFDCANVIMESKKFNPNAGNQFDRTPLFMAAKLGQPNLVRRLLNIGARVNDADIRGVTPLGACAWHDSHESAEILIKNGANVDQPDVVGQTPLYRACSNVGKNMAKVLLNYSCDVNLPTCDRKTPLMAALPSVYNQKVAGKTLSDMMSICKMLVLRGCDVNAQDEHGRTALHHTVENNDIYGMCFLAEHGSDLEIKDNPGYTAFHTAILPRRPRYELAKYLLHFGADGKNNMLNPNEQEDPVISPLRLLLRSRPNRAMDIDTKWSRTMLLRTLSGTVYPHDITIRDHAHKLHTLPKENLNFHEQVELDVVQWLNESSPCALEHQARLKIRELTGKTNSLIKIDSLPIGTRMKQYLNLGLNPRTLSLDTVCRLHSAIQDGDNQTVKRLLDDRTNTTLPLNNRNALTLAIEIGNTEAAMMIIKYEDKVKNPPCISISTPSQDSALHIAAKHGRTDIVEEMIRLHGDVNAKNATGGTPLQEAILAGHFETAAILIKSGANLNLHGYGVPIIHLAAASGAAEVVEMLLSRGWDVDAVDVFGNTPLLVAASKGTEYIYRHISLPALYQDQGTALVDAINIMMTQAAPALTKKISTHAATIECLLKFGADVDIPNSQSKTALMSADDSEDSEVINALKGLSKARLTEEPIILL